MAGLAKDVDGIDSLFTLVQGMLNQNRLRDIIRNFIYLPDTSKKNEKILCRYPQYYAAKCLYDNIKLAQKPQGDGKGNGVRNNLSSIENYQNRNCKKGEEGTITQI